MRDLDQLRRSAREAADEARRYARRARRLAVVAIIFGIVALSFAVLSWTAGASEVPEVEPEIGTALRCEVVSETEIECVEVDEAGVVVRQWREAR